MPIILQHIQTYIWTEFCIIFKYKIFLILKILLYNKHYQFALLLKQNVRGRLTYKNKRLI